LLPKYVQKQFLCGNYNYLQNGVMLLNTQLIKNIFKKIIFDFETNEYGHCGDMTMLNYLASNKKIISDNIITFKYSANSTIHHVCGTSCRPG
jgi:hypothetical protein